MNICNTFCLPTHQLMDIWVVSTFWLLWIMLLWTLLQVSMWTYIFISLGYTPRSGISGSYGNSMFNILRNCRTVFQSDCITLHSHQQCMRVSISLHPLWYLLSAFFNYSHPHGCGVVSYCGLEQIYLFFFWPHCTAYRVSVLSSLTRDWTQAKVVKAPNPNH